MSEPNRLEDVLTTDKLTHRPSRSPDFEAENRALQTLAQELAERPHQLLQKLAETALELIPSADSTGVSICVPGEHDVRWEALAGAFAPYVGDSMPHEASPCGLVVDRGATLLFEHPHRYFSALQEVEPAIRESLLVPFYVDDQPAGTLWVAAHDPAHQFAQEDARLLSSLSQFASTGYQLANSLKATRHELDREIAQRERADVEARESQRRFQAVFEHSLDVILLTNDQGRYVDANPAACELLGYSTDELCELSVWDLTPEGNQPEGLRQWRQFLAEGQMAGEYTVLRKDGTPVEVEFRATANVLPGLHLSIMRDITERKKAEEALREMTESLERRVADRTAELAFANEALRESEEKYRTLFESIDEGFVLFDVAFDENGRATDAFYLEANPAASRMTGKEWVGKWLSEIDAGFEPYWLEIFGRVAKTGQGERLQRYAEPLKSWYDFYVFPVDEAERPRMAIVFQDITKEKEAEAQLRKMATQLTRAEHKERRRIARVLHDDLQQRLYSIQMRLLLLRKSAEEGQQEALMRNIDTVEDWLAKGIEITRELTVDLSPPVLKSEGLVDALSWLTGQMLEMHDLKVELKADHSFRLSDEDMHVLLFQIVRELLFNVVKHADTNRATVELCEEREGLVIRVEDRGRGFISDAETWKKQPEGGFGLRTAHERLRLFGGELEVHSTPGEGTRATVYAPVAFER